MYYFVLCYGKNSFDSLVCSGNGYCVDIDNCLCKCDFRGNKCEIPVCFGYASDDSRVCSRNGICEKPNTCKCDPGYSGENCSKMVVSGSSRLSKIIFFEFLLIFLCCTF